MAVLPGVCRSGQRERAVSPSAQPTEVRILPPPSRWDTSIVEVPEIEYTRSGDVAIAYQTFGDGQRDLVFVPMFSNLVFPWANSDWRGMYDRFASFSRLIMFDKRGTGLSDRPRELGPLETRMDDIRAVLDAVGTDRATLVGMGE